MGIGAWAWKLTRPDPPRVMPDPPRVMVAVLPFEMMGVNLELQYLEDALHEETIAALGQVDPERIGIVTRRLVLPYLGTKKPPVQVAQELGADFLVESSIVTESGRIRVRSKLLRARDQQEVWSDSYENTPRSMLDFQRELALTLAAGIQHRLSQDRLDVLARRHTGNTEAFQLYLQGLHAWNQLKPPQTTQRAIELYTRATQLDPSYALPWAGLAIAYAGAPINGDADAQQVGPAARRTAAQAMAADPSLAEARTAMGAVKFWFDWDWAAAERLYRGATDADPGYAFARRMIGILLSHQGRHEEARQHMRELFTLEPKYEMNWALRAQVAYNAGDYPEAIAHAKDALALQPRFWIADYQLAMAYEQSGQTDLALATLDKHLSEPTANSKLLSLRGYIVGKIGRHGEARAVLSTLETASRHRYVPPYANALVYAGLGERAAALDWLERADRESDVHLIALAVDAKWAPYRNDPRFLALMKRRGIRTN
jgi:TolB-like protein/Tfp pilus assembly protein PilF